MSSLVTTSLIAGFALPETAFGLLQLKIHHQLIHAPTDLVDIHLLLRSRITAHEDRVLSRNRCASA